MGLTSALLSRIGAALVTGAALLLTGGLAGYATGDEAALFPMMASLALFTTGIGVLSVGRDRR